MKLKNIKIYLLLLFLFFSSSFFAKESKFVVLSLPNDKQIIAELALTPEQWERGLMYRKEIPENYGMLFVFKEEINHFFWMKNTYISLDILWLDHNKEVIHIVENCEPCFKKICPTYGGKVKAKYVLELKAGAITENNIEVGDEIFFIIEEN